MNKFKVGDKVVRTIDVSDTLPVGTKCKISNVSSGGRSITIKGRPEVCYQASNFELAPEIETVEHDGQSWQIGKLYAFSDVKDDDACISRLASISPYDPQRPYGDIEGFTWKYIKAMDPSELGTVTPAPVELIDGAAYTFKRKGVTRIGVFNEHTKRFIRSDGWVLVSECTNIRLMTVGSE
tara:strand:+ start:2404 stop:2946 length:543 start_codon:yes stop_codon:yes gene_type:complete